MNEPNSSHRCPPCKEQKKPRKPKALPCVWPPLRDVLRGISNYGDSNIVVTRRDYFAQPRKRVEWQEREVNTAKLVKSGVCGTAEREVKSIRPALLTFRKERMRQQMLADEALLNELLSKKMGCRLASSHVLPRPKGI
ncbi:unnamed protein product [Mesocestoides corti]|uniref:ALMS motif domain-containing protein n=1 Tax=Mesocestoides corti TaxID=53468 RepID=A0A0R3UJH0_MESCO|nr:unnamed protein product [Mesocestoides corti]